MGDGAGLRLGEACVKDTDASFNVGFALAALQTLPEGVYLAMNGRIFDPHRVRKNPEKDQFEVDD